MDVDSFETAENVPHEIAGYRAETSFGRSSPRAEGSRANGARYYARKFALADIYRRVSPDD